MTRAPAEVASAGTSRAIGLGAPAMTGWRIESIRTGVHVLFVLKARTIGPDGPVAHTHIAVECGPLCSNGR